LSILGIYLFASELFRKRKNWQFISLLSMAIFAISPWSIQFSRVAFEATVGLGFVLLGAWLFLRGVRTDKKWQIILSILPFALSAYTYHSEKIFSPIFFVCLIIFGWRYFFKKRVFMIILLFLFFIANVFWLVDARTVARGESVLFTSQQTQILQISTQEIIYDKSRHDELGVILHNRRLEFTATYIDNYLSQFNPNWLFVTGDLARHHAPGVGILYLLSLPILLVGIYILLFQYKNEAILIMSWLILSPVAGALAVGVPNAERALIMLPVFVISESIGFVFLIGFLHKKTALKILFYLFLLLYLGNIIYYFHQYFICTNRDNEQYWQYGYAQAMRVAQAYEEKGKQVFIGSDFEQPYIFYLFYNHYESAKYLQTGGSTRTLQKCFMIDNVHFGTCESQIQSGDIYITTKSSAPFLADKISDISYSDGSEAVGIYRKK